MTRDLINGWKVSGINLIPSDSIFIKLVNAIKDNNLEQTYLQNQTGHRAPIVIDHSTKTIDFYRS